MHQYGDFSYFQNVDYGQSGHMQKATLAPLKNTDDPDYPSGNTVDLVTDIGANASKAIDNQYVSDLIELGIKKVINSERRAIYNELQDIWMKEYLTIPITQPTGRDWQRDWVQGWYYNPITPGYYYRHLWKGLNADINGDDVVNLGDGSEVSAHWFSPGFPEGTLGYDRDADIYPIMEMDGPDYMIEGADGKVNIADAALINAEWHDNAVGT